MMFHIVRITFHLYLVHICLPCFVPDLQDVDVPFICYTIWSIKIHTYNDTGFITLITVNALRFCFYCNRNACDIIWWKCDFQSNVGPTLIAKCSRPLTLTAFCLPPPPGFESCSGHVLLSSHLIRYEANRNQTPLSWFIKPCINCFPFLKVPEVNGSPGILFYDILVNPLPFPLWRGAGTQCAIH